MKLKKEIEKDWITNSNFRAIIIHYCYCIESLKLSKDQLDSISIGHRCGYLNIPKDHALYEVNYEEIEKYFQVHGGITFSGNLPFIDPNLFWFGYDCSHHNDKTSFNPNGIERTLDYCIKECEFLAEQIAEETPLSLFYLSKKLGKLPEEKHNRMMAFGIEDPHNEFVLRYLKS